MASFKDVDDAFEELERELGDVAESFEDLSRRAGRHSAKDAMATGFSRAMNDVVLPEARRNAPGGESGEVAGQIWGEDEGVWRNDRYEHFLFGGPLAAIHEWGSGAHATDMSKRWGQPLVPRDGTPPMGYLIPEGGVGGPVAFTMGGKKVVVEQIVHPGVPAQHMIRNAIRDNEGVIRHEVGSYLGGAISKALHS